MPPAPAVHVLPVRALLVGGTSLAMATAAHAAAGGGAPRSALAVAVLVASVVPVAVALGRGALTLPRLLPVLGLLQALLHAELAVLATHGTHGVPSPGAGAGAAAVTAGHAAHGVDPVALAHLDATAAAAGGGHGGGTLMAVAHVVAVALVAAVLASGDRAARWVVAWMSAVALLVRRAALPLPRSRPAAVVVDRLVGARALERLIGAGRRFRGPPGLVCPSALATPSPGAA
ncbi:hypothetical protein UQW22_01665 [Isoptericola halotolerans]|uniref:hypothetical protein n=1 Tax=Isoptericola halotolerans TaxID=300560 RepID=UPI00388CF2E1